MLQAQSSRIPLTLRQRIFLMMLFLLALMLSYFIVSNIDPLTARLHFSSILDALPSHYPTQFRCVAEAFSNSGGLLLRIFIAAG